MKKFVITLFFIIGAATSLLAQKPQVYITLSGGFGSAKGKDAKLSSGIGTEFLLPFSEKVGLNVKPTINFRGYNGTALISTVKATYFDVPVMFEFAADDNKNHLFFGLGGYVGFALGGKYKNNNGTGGGWQKLKFGEAVTDNRSPLDYGIALSVGGYWETYHRSVKFGLQPMLGLKNVVPKASQNLPNATDIKLRNISLYLAIGLSKH
ncbi:MAG: outer membrane beta-barrel protein [Flavihumibacter sp.]|nr:outer membrane beta-barrel protein [Flavihumibacter sp.]